MNKILAIYARYVAPKLELIASAKHSLQLSW